MITVIAANGMKITFKSNAVIGYAFNLNKTNTASIELTGGFSIPVEPQEAKKILRL